MKSSETVDEANESGAKALLNIAFDRLRNNFYGYLITSLILFNLENIIIIFKSKAPIELTLLYIGFEKEFIFNYFWWPLVWGMLASIVMPVITALYSVLIGVIKAVRDDSHPLGEGIWVLFKSDMRNRLTQHEETKKRLIGEINDLINERDSLNSNIVTTMKQKENLDKYINELANIYHEYMDGNSKPNLLELLKAIEEAQLREHIPSKDILKHMTRFIKDNTESQTENPPKEL